VHFFDDLSHNSNVAGVGEVMGDVFEEGMGIVKREDL
jgi:hypothetical protein